MGRKNWMFAGSDNGGHTATVLLSFTASARRHELDQWRYLRDVLSRLPIRASAPSEGRVRANRLRRRAGCGNPARSYRWAVGEQITHGYAIA